ncbi:MAG TPA: hypothetical protein HA276_00970, partial [Candidatus Poseidoniaceae archaeon]
MDPLSMALTGVLGAAFSFGVLRLVLRRDSRIDLRQGLVAEGLGSRVAGADFTTPRAEFDRQLAKIQSQRRRFEADDARQRARSAALLEREEEARRKEEDARRRMEEAEIRRAEEARLKREAEEEARLRSAREAEEARLAEEREAARQAELAEIEIQRQAEVEAARAQAEMEARAAAERSASELRARLEREGASSSDVQISLMWNNFNDLDLHVVCPSGERIHGGAKESKCGGVLDVDANVKPDTRRPIENVVWPEGIAPGGVYQVYVHHYKKHAKRRSRDPTRFSIIINAGDDIREYTGEMSAGDPIKKVCEFTVDPPEVRAARRAELHAQLAAADEALATGKFQIAPASESEDEPEDEPAIELPPAPDLDEMAAAEEEAEPEPEPEP